MVIESMSKKILAVIAVEVVYALIFMVLLFWVGVMNDATQLSIFTPDMVLTIWAILGIGTPVAVFTPIIEALKKLIDNIK